MDLSTLETETDKLNAVVRDAGIELARTRDEFQKVGAYYRDQKSGKEALRLLNRWKQAAESAGLPIPEDLPMLALEAVEVLRQALTLHLNGQEAVKHATRVGRRHMDIPIPARFTVGQRDWKCGKVFKANETYDSSEVPAGFLAQAIRYGTVLRAEEPMKQTA